jgi:hypothetical protein
MVPRRAGLDHCTSISRLAAQDAQLELEQFELLSQA